MLASDAPDAIIRSEPCETSAPAVPPAATMVRVLRPYDQFLYVPKTRIDGKCSNGQADGNCWVKVAATAFNTNGYIRCARHVLARLNGLLCHGMRHASLLMSGLDGDKLLHFLLVFCLAACTKSEGILRVLAH